MEFRVKSFLVLAVMAVTYGASLIAHAASGLTPAQNKVKAVLENFDGAQWIAHKGVFRVKKGACVGVVDTLARIVLPADTYDYVNWFPGLDGRYEVGINRQYGVADYNGKEIIPPVYDNVKYIIADSVFQVRKNGTVGIRAVTGEVLIGDGMFSDLKVLSKPHGLYKAYCGDRVGVVSADGHEILPAEFNSVALSCQSKTLGPVFNVKRGGKSGMYDLRGKMLVPPVYDSQTVYDPASYGYEFGWIKVGNGPFSGVYDFTGNKLTEADRFTSINYNELKTDYPHFIAQDDEKNLAVLDTCGRVLLPLVKAQGVGIRKNPDSSTGYEIDLTDYTTGRIWAIELFTGKVLLDNGEEVRFYEWISNGDRAFDSKDYASAVQWYTKALGFRRDENVIFNRALAYYNSSKYNEAIEDFNLFNSISEDKASIQRASRLIQKSNNELYPSRNYDDSQDEPNIALCLMGLAMSIFNPPVSPKSNGMPSGLRAGSSRPSAQKSSGNAVSSATGARSRKCGFCAGKGSIVEYTANYGVSDKKFCGECGKNMPAGHYHKTCSKCNGQGSY